MKGCNKGQSVMGITRLPSCRANIISSLTLLFLHAKVEWTFHLSNDRSGTEDLSSSVSENLATSQPGTNRDHQVLAHNPLTVQPLAFGLCHLAWSFTR